MKVIFKINQDYLIAHTLISCEERDFSSREYKKDIITFQDYAWGVSKDLYNAIPERVNIKIALMPGGFAEYAKKVSQLGDYFNQLKQSDEFKVIFEQTEKYRQFCENEWNKNYERTRKVIQDLTQFDFEKDFEVFITHPSLRRGRGLGGNKIAWGHAEDWPNYTVVYLWHEILHSYMGNAKLNHALIELITDYELRRQLGGPEYPPFTEGHDYLHSIRDKLLPYWQKYLGSENKNFADFQEKAKKLANL